MANDKGDPLDDLPDDTDPDAPQPVKKARKARASKIRKEKTKARKVKTATRSKPKTAGITRLRREVDHKEPKVGATFTKTYKGRKHTLRVVKGKDGDVRYAVSGKEYNSPTAAAGACVDTDTSPNGWTWWGIESLANGAKPAAKKSKTKAKV